MTEGQLLREIMLAVSSDKLKIFRNNCGVLQDIHGQYIKYGVANPGGADCLGWKSTIIDSSMVGLTIAQFIAIEVKTSKGQLTKEQKNFIDQVRLAGGIAGVARSVKDALQLLRQR